MIIDQICFRNDRRSKARSNGTFVCRQGETWQKLRAALTPKLMGANTVSGFVPALNQVSDDFINLIRVLRSGDDVTGFKELAYRMGLESEFFFFSLFACHCCCCC